MKLTLQEFLRDVSDMPSLPAVYYDIRREIHNPNSSADTIATIIMKDPGLAARILRVSNSAYYGLPRRVETIEEALQIIGLNEAHSLVLATSVINMFKGLREDLVNTQSFWLHSVSCGIGARLLGMERCEPNTERLFLGGLLHDIGRLAMYLKLPTESAEVLERCSQNAELKAKVETEVIGFDHAELGGALLEWWRLPSSLADMVRFHHRPTFSRIASTDTAIVHTADFIVNALELGSSGEHLVPPLSAEGWRRTQLNEGCLERVMEEIEKQTVGMTQILTNNIN